MVLSASLSFFSSTCVRVCSAISVLSVERCIHEVWREHVASLVGKWVALPALSSRQKPLLFPNCRRRCSRSLQICQHFEHQHKHKSKHKQGTVHCAQQWDLCQYSAAIPASASRPPRAHQLFMASLFPLPIHWPPTFLPFPPVRLPTATLEPNNHLPKPKSLGPSVRSVRPFWFEITVPSSYNSLLPLD